MDAGKSPRLACLSYHSGDFLVFAFSAMDLMAFSPKSYIFLKGTREADGKGNVLVLTFGGDGSAVKLYNFLGDGQAQAGSACGSAPGGIQTEELLKNLAQLLRRDGFATVFHPDRCLLPCCSK